MVKVLRSFTTFSIILFVIALLVVYAFLPESPGWLFSQKGESMQIVSRNIFFYTSLISFFTIQLLFYLFVRFVLDKKNGSKKKEIMSLWFRGMIVAVNLFFILNLIYLGLANNAVDFSYETIQPVAYAGPGLLFIWILSFPLFYFYRRK